MTSSAASPAVRPATDPAGPIGRLATWVAETTLDDVPASVRDRARHLTSSGLAERAAVKVVRTLR
jgi:hypothetical protein